MTPLKLVPLAGLLVALLAAPAASAGSLVNVIVLNNGFGVGANPLSSGDAVDVNVLSYQPCDANDVLDVTVGGKEGAGLTTGGACSDNGDRVDLSVLSTECTDNQDLLDVRLLGTECTNVGDTVHIGL